MKVPIKLRRREVAENIDLPKTLSPLLRRIYASRGIRRNEDLERGIKGVLPWQQLSSIHGAATMLCDALYKKKRIVVVGDFDTDGATSTALVVLCLRAFGCNNITYLVSNRFENSYGLSPEIVDQAKACGAQIIVTVDNGISSHEGINRAQELGISVLVTDHHLPGDILPAANAIVNPNLRDCNFPSKSLSGVGVAFYLMLAVRALLYNKDWFKSHDIVVPNLANYLDLVALGTVADVVPLDTNNRILIWQGLIRIRAGKCRPGIKALLKISNCNPLKIAASDLGFSLGPRLNAAGRLEDMSIGVALLLCENFSEAQILANKLNTLNQSRKEIEQRMHSEALILCEKLEHSNGTLPSGLVIYHPKWHQGVIGILASRIKEHFCRPVIVFAKTKNGILKGSGRSIQELHMLDVLKHLDVLHPELMIKFGGHAMAAGLLLEEMKLDTFQSLFNKLVADRVNPDSLQSEIISDGELSSVEMTIETAQMLRDAGPWGQMFPEPLFDGRFQLLQQRIVRDRHLKVVVKPINDGPLLEGIAFNVDTSVWLSNRKHEVVLAYKLGINEFRGNRSLQLIINHIWPIS